MEVFIQILRILMKNPFLEFIFIAVLIFLFMSMQLSCLYHSNELLLYIDNDRDKFHVDFLDFYSFNLDSYQAF